MVFHFDDAEAKYAISTGERDKERLMILNDLYNSESLAKLDLKPGMKILTIGCGIALLEQEIAKRIGPGGQVLATDASPEQLTIARESASNAQIDNIRFEQMDVLNIEQLEGTFDCIHCRFVLSHMQWHLVEKVLPKIINKLSPEGTFILEEISTLYQL